MQKALLAKVCTCTHCGSPIPSSDSSFEGTNEANFCCLGCKMVYGILQSRNLTHYYDLKRSGDNSRRPQPVTHSGSSFSFLSDPEFIKLYATNDGKTMQFFLEGVHCAACVWLVEKLPEFVPSVESASLNLGESVATIHLKEPNGFGAAALEIDRLGYRPHPVKDGNFTEHQKRQNKLELIRIGVAAAATGNIMLLAISLYGGLRGGLSDYFRWISFALYLPVFFFSAIPFFRGAVSSLRIKRVSIDVPVALGILIGTIASTINLLNRSEHIYFDSLSTFVFLLLLSRYLLKRTQQIALSSAGLMHFLTPSIVRKRNPLTGEIEEVNIDVVQLNDILEVRVGDSIPTDGVIEEGRTLLNCSLLTGEADLVDAGVGTRVFAGTTNQQSPIYMSVSASGAGTRLGKILKATEESGLKKSKTIALADRTARVFVMAVVALATGTFTYGYFHFGFQRALEFALGMVIVTCPCALALATPLALAMAMSRAAKAGILIKSAEVLEKIENVRDIFLDKTGTLTEGSFEVLECEWLIDSEDKKTDWAATIVSIESYSNHPVAKALVKHFKSFGNLALVRFIDFKEQIGKGVSGLVESGPFASHEIKIESLKVPVERPGTWIGVHQNGKLVLKICLGDRLRCSTTSSIQSLKDLNLNLAILSGDHESAVSRISKVLKISRYFSNATPESKNELITSNPNAMMVGDGANDAIALASAYLGVAVHGGMEVSMRAADVYIQRPGISPIVDLMLVGRESMKVVRRNIIFSIAYNIFGVAGVLTGFVGPLFAAILMPISALTVFASSVYGTEILREVERGREE